MEPVFTNDAVVLGILLVVLALVFVTAGSERPFWKNFYRFVPSLLLCYFIPALLNWPLGLIAPDWYDNDLLRVLAGQGIQVPAGASVEEINRIIEQSGIDPATVAEYRGSSGLYFMASRYLLPASLVLLCISIDIKGILGLGPKALIMFLAATAGVVFGGPIALLLVTYLMPDIFNATPDELWRGLSTIAGSWIGGGANQTAMKEIFDVDDNLFASMVVVDVIVANIWMGFLLYGAGIADRIDARMKADNSAIVELQRRVEEYQASVTRLPTLKDTMLVLAVGFGITALSTLLADLIVPALAAYEEQLTAIGLNALISSFFWIVVLATTFGLLLSFTPLRSLEGVGASRIGSVFIYVLVATIGMSMNLGDVFNRLGVFAVGVVWMLVHITVLLLVARLIRAPFFFVAVGSQANIGGAASAPIVASAFSPTLAPVGVLLAVLGYALGTYGGIICAYMMRAIVT